MPEDITSRIDFDQHDPFAELLQDLADFRKKYPMLPIEEWDLMRAQRESLVYRALWLKTLALWHEDITRSAR